jgi:Cu+-exporting ATPase
MMVRREFIQGIACGLGAAEAAGSRAKTKTVTYRIEGFTCITCAVGLDALLKDQKGIVRSKSSYPERTAIVEYNPGLINEEQIKAFIQEFGFTAT